MAKKKVKRVKKTSKKKITSKKTAKRAIKVQKKLPQKIELIPAKKSNGSFALSGFIISLVALCLYWIPFLGLITSVIGLILCSIGMKSKVFRGISIAGLIFSLTALIISSIVTIGFLAPTSA